jgi:hypothetical protein
MHGYYLPVITMHKGIIADMLEEVLTVYRLGH